MDWDKLRIFQAVADAGSFTHAGESLKLSQSAISRQIGALEEQLGVMLFHRHARGLILTEGTFTTTGPIVVRTQSAGGVGSGAGWAAPEVDRITSRLARPRTGAVRMSVPPVA
jgi:hypothetical protein